MRRRGAGGSEGGEWAFFLGLVMMVGGGYLLLSEIIVRPQFGFGAALYTFGGVGITTGMILIPFAFGVGMIFYNASNWIGWFLAGASLLAMIFGVIANLTIGLATMSVFDLIVILVLLVGGIGLFLRSLKDRPRA